MSLSHSNSLTPASPASPESIAVDVESEDQDVSMESSNQSRLPHFLSRLGPDFDESRAYQYPLASSETPSFLRSFHFTVDGEDALFRELGVDADDSTAGSFIGAFPVDTSSSSSSSSSKDAKSSKKRNRHFGIPMAKRLNISCETHSDDVTSNQELKLADIESLSPGKDTSALPAAITPDDEDVARSELPTIDDESSPNVALPSPSVSPVTGSHGSRPLSGVDNSFGQASVSKNVSECMDKIASMISSFDELPVPLRNYVLYNLMRRCDRRSLSFLSGLINPALRCDLLTVLPAELSYKILGYLDVKTLCSASQVSKEWHQIVDGSEWIWKDLLERDELNVTEKDLERAHNENWDYTGWGSSTRPSHKVNIYKAIYRRKYLIRRNWMDSNSKPKHLAVRGHGRDVVTCLQFDDDQIITGSDDRTINVYDTKTGELKRRFEGHEGGVWALKYINKNTLISGSTDRTVRVWDIEKAKCTHVFYGHTSTVRCLDTVEPVKQVDPVTNQVYYTPPYPIIITGSRDATLRIWKLPGPDDPPHIPQNATDGTYNDPYFLRALRGHTSSVRALSGYEDTVVSGSYDTTVRVWKISTGQCQWVLTGHAQRVYSAVLDHKRNRCISGSMDWLVKVWSIETGSLLYTLEGHTSLVGLLDLNRTTLVSAAADSTLRVWDPETGASIHKLEGHQGAIACFQHDENKVVSGSDPILKLWNIRTGKLVRDLLTNLSKIWQVCFDERRCVAAVKRDNDTYIEVLDFDYDPYAIQ